MWPEIKARRARPGRLRLLRGRGGPGAEAAEGPHLGAARRPYRRAGARRRRRPGQHRRGGVLPARGPPAPVLPAASAPPPQDEPKGFTWAGYRDLIIIAHRQLGAPVVWCWDNLNVHLAPQLAEFIAENKAWLRVYRLPAYAPELNPAEMSLPQCELRRSSLPWLPGSLSVEVSSIGVPSSVQRRRLWYPAGSWCRARRRSTSAWSAAMIHR